MKTISMFLLFFILVTSSCFAFESVAIKGNSAKQSVKNLPCSKGGTVDQYLSKKASVPAVDDLGWVTTPYQGGFQVERILLLGHMRLIYRWEVDTNGKVKALNGKAIEITRSE